jgi:hypothetical protein
MWTGNAEKQVSVIEKVGLIVPSRDPGGNERFMLARHRENFSWGSLSITQVFWGPFTA